MSPQRIRLRRTRGWRKPNNAVVVTRASRWGNPFSVAEHGRERAIQLYRQYLRDSPDLVAAIRRELAGRDVACFCRSDEDCHGDVLLPVAAGGEP